jgi:hypothetical protein
MMEDFKEQIWELKNNNPVILYLLSNPTCLETFNDSRFRVELKKYINLIILEVIISSPNSHE